MYSPPYDIGQKCHIPVQCHTYRLHCCSLPLLLFLHHLIFSYYCYFYLFHPVLSASKCFFVKICHFPLLFWHHLPEGHPGRSPTATCTPASCLLPPISLLPHPRCTRPISCATGPSPGGMCTSAPTCAPPVPKPALTTCLQKPPGALHAAPEASCICSSLHSCPCAPLLSWDRRYLCTHLPFLLNPPLQTCPHRPFPVLPVGIQ